MSDPIYSTNIGALVIRFADPGASVSGICPFEAAQGLIVVQDPTDPNKFAKATGVRGRRLERPVTTEIPLTDLIFKNQLFRPDLVNSGTSARATRIEEVEGGDLLLLEGTGAITNALADRTPLSTKDGKLRVRQAAVEASEGVPAVPEDELYGYLRAQLTPLLADSTVRILVETVY